MDNQELYSILIFKKPQKKKKELPLILKKKDMTSKKLMEF